MATKQENEKRKKIALGICIPVTLGAVAAGIAVPLVLLNRNNPVEVDAIPFEAYNIERGKAYHHGVDSEDCNILKGFNQTWLANNDITQYKSMVIPNTVDYVDGNAFYIYDDETETAHSTIPSNITSLSFEERKDNAERPFLGLAESCFCEAPFVKISLPKHFGGSYSAYNMSDVERTDGAFKGCPNVTTLDLTAFDDETAYRCLNGIDYNTFANWPESGVIIYGDNISEISLSGLKTAIYNCGLNKKTWFDGVTPHATTVIMDENNIVTGFSPLVTDHEIYAELYYYDGSGILHMPHGAKGIAAGAFQEWGGQNISSMIRGIALEDWDGQCSIEYIGDQAFAGCKFASEVANAVTINFPKSVKTIGQASFAAINDLKRVTFDRLDNGSRIFGAGAFMGDKNLELPSFADACVTQVPEYAFSGCNHLTTDGDFTLDGCITNIGSNAFEDSGLKNIVLQPDTTLTIESNAFDSNALETIDIGGISDFNCLTLKDNAFPSTSGTITGFAGSADWQKWQWKNDILTKFTNAGITGWNVGYTIEDLYAALFKVSEIDEKYYINGFNYDALGTNGLTGPEIDKLLLEIEQPESGVLDTIKFPAKIGKGANEKTIQGVANFGEGHYFPATVSTIDFSAFDKDANAIVIGERAFYNDDQISTIIFTDQYGGVFHGVSMIDKEAFAGCDGLATLKLPKGIVIHEKAFYSCSYMYNLDLSDWDHNFITSKIETSQYSIGLNAFAGFRSDGWIKYADDVVAHDKEILCNFLTDTTQASLDETWVASKAIMEEPAKKTIYTKANNNAASFNFKLLVTDYDIDWTISLDVHTEESTPGISIDYPRSIETYKDDDTLSIPVTFTNSNLVNGDYVSFDINLSGESIYGAGSITFPGYKVIYTGSIDPVTQTLDLKTDTFEKNKDFQFKVHDTEIKQLSDLDITFTPNGQSSLGVTPTCDSTKITYDTQNKILTIPVVLSKDGSLSNDDKGCFDLTIASKVGAAEDKWTKTFTNCSLTYVGYEISCSAVQQVTSNVDWAPFSFLSTKPLTTTDYTYFAKVSEINISRDSGHISLGLFTEQGALIKRLSQNEEIEIGKNQLSTLCFGLVTNDGSGDDIQVLSGDKCTFKLVYGYKKGTASFVELGNSDNLTLTISNSRINIESGQETQITKAGQKDVSYKFNLAKNWVSGMSLYATISNSTGSFEPVFDDGSSIKLLTTTPGSKNVNVGIKIPDSATPLDLQSASFSITFSAKDGDTEVWNKTISSLTLKYSAARLTLVDDSRIVAIGATQPYAIYEFTIKDGCYDTIFYPTISNASGSLTPTLSSTEYYDQGNKKVYVKVLFSGQTITADSNCSFDLTIGNKAVAADWEQTFTNLTATGGTMFSNAGVSKTVYNTWTGSYKLNLAQALETSPADKQSIRISELTITGSGTSDAKVASDSTAKSDAGSETANFNFTMGSNSGKSLVDIDRSASTYWTEFSLKAQVVDNHGQTVYEQQLTNLRTVLSGVPIYSGYYDHESISYGTTTRDIPFDVAEDFNVGTNYWVVKWVETTSGNTKVNENATVVSITGKKLTLQIKFDSTGFIMHNSTEGYFVFSYYANGDALSGGTPTWTFTTTGNAFKYW